ncbi:MAG: hypothetical protein JXD21_08990 [Candidatus Omnitrophica bacterium]|nr:hypothetical protein [Candidatus Omnitrophota bacterium]
MKHIEKRSTQNGIRTAETKPLLQLPKALKLKLKTKCFDSELFALLQKSGLSNEELFRIFYL